MMVKQQDKLDGHEHWRDRADAADRIEFPWRITTAAGELMGSRRTEADAKALARMLARVNMGSQFHVKRVGT